MNITTLTEDEREEISNALDMFAYHLDSLAHDHKHTHGKNNAITQDLHKRAGKLRLLSLCIENIEHK